MRAPLYSGSVRRMSFRFADQLDGINAAGAERIMSTNMFELLNLPRPVTAEAQSA
jgi:hypothetical protein